MKSLLEQFLHNNFLITTDGWFFAPDGKQYKAVWGKIKVYSDADTLGIKTNDKSTNRYAIVGEIGAGKSVVIAGCQIKYACLSMDKPVTINQILKHCSTQLAKGFEWEMDNPIYIAQ